jgi:hypothetical protein
MKRSPDQNTTLDHNQASDLTDRAGTPATGMSTTGSDVRDSVAALESSIRQRLDVAERSREHLDRAHELGREATARAIASAERTAHQRSTAIATQADESCAQVRRAAQEDVLALGAAAAAHRRRDVARVLDAVLPAPTPESG